MFKFNNKNILTPYIKNKLKDENIIDIPVFKLGNSVIEGERYIIGDALVIVTSKASKSPIPENDLYWFETDEFNALPYKDIGQVGSPGYVLGRESKEKEYNSIYWFKLLKKVWDFKPEDDYKNYISNSSYYDWLTHFYMDKYLTYLNNHKNINLFSMYNVWGGQTISNIYLKKERRVITEKDKEGNIINTTEKKHLAIKKVNSATKFNVLKVDILPNQDYTLFFESDVPVLVCAVAYNNGRFILSGFEAGEYTCMKTAEYEFTTMSFREPKVISAKVDVSPDITENKAEVAALKDYLTLLIQVPKTSKMNLVLKGRHENLSRIFDETLRETYYNGVLKKHMYDDYSNSNPEYLEKDNEKIEATFGIFDSIRNYEKVAWIEDSHGDIFYSSSPYYEEGVAIFNNNYIKNIPNLNKFWGKNVLSDTLFQYLLNYAITSDEEHGDNVVFIKDKLSTVSSRNNDIKFKLPVDSSYDNSFRNWVYDFAKKNLKSFELTGFIDKDIEDYINRLVGE